MTPAAYSFTVLDEVGSTQDVAREKVSAGRPAVVVAHRQTGGRGRSGTVWETAPRAVAVSVGMVPRWNRQEWSLIPLLAGVAARRVLGTSVGLKWPNDILLGEKKAGGILVEARDEVVVVGLGLNLHWPDPPPRAAGLFPADPGPDEGPRLAVDWAESLLGLVSEGPDRWPAGEYAEACVTLGRDIVWEPNGTGTATGIGPDGSLEVVTPDGRRRFLSSGEVRHVRPT